jgi:hypothetical protein
MSGIYIEYLREKTIFKEVTEMTFDELKVSFNSRLVEKAQSHPQSAFQKFWDEEMILIQKEIKLRKNNKN